MRHLSLLFILLATAINAYCQQNSGYEIFKTIGSISKATTGQQVKKGDAVRPADKLVIGKDSKAAILDCQQHRIYYGITPGTYSVAAIVRDAKRKADNAVAAVNSEIINQSKQASRRPSVNGVAYRGSEGEDTYLQSVCNALLDITSSMPDSCLTLKAIENEGAFHFSMANASDSLLYVNVIAVRPDGTLRLCLNVGMTDNEPFICIAPNSQLDLSEFEFVESDSNDYYMFASMQPVNTQALSLLLNSGNRFEEAGNATIIVAPKIKVHPYE